MTVRFLADENFDNDIVGGVLRLVEDVDIALVQEVELRTLDDPTILEWAAREGRVVLSHDKATLITFAYERVSAELAMPGLFVVSTAVPIRVAIEQIATAAVASEPEEWDKRVVFVPWH